VVGGSLLVNSVRSMMGGAGSHQSFGDTAAIGDKATSQNPWSDQSSSNLARDAGVNDVASSQDRADDDAQDRDDDNSRAGLFDQASKDDDRDDMDLDSDDFGGDGDSDNA
jgi:hypothetical protein